MCLCSNFQNHGWCIFKLPLKLGIVSIYIFFYQSLLSHTLGDLQDNRKEVDILFPLYHLLPVKNIQTFICSFAFEMITPFIVTCSICNIKLLLYEIYPPLGISI